MSHVNDTVEASPIRLFLFALGKKLPICSSDPSLDTPFVFTIGVTLYADKLGRSVIG